MIRELVEDVGVYTAAHADTAGVARTAISGMTLVRTTEVGELQYRIERPLVCLIVQGTKEVTIGADTFSFSAGDSMLIAADVPTVSRITKASRVAPYLSFALYLNQSLIADLSLEMVAPPAHSQTPLQLLPTDAEVRDTALRMVRLLARPASVPVLQQQLVREMHYWLLAGRHGAAMHQLGFPDSQARCIARAVEVIRRELTSHMPIERLASVAGMSLSTFHHHFRAVTSLSPLQFQKQLRLIEARRMMLAEGATPSNAAYAVGYASVPQFTRDYGRLFGLPPARETGIALRRVQEAA